MIETYYKTREETCRGCGGQAKELYENSPYCRTCIKQIENENNL